MNQIRYAILRNKDEGYVRRDAVTIMKQTNDEEGNEDWIVYLEDVNTRTAADLVRLLNQALEYDRQQAEMARRVE